MADQLVVIAGVQKHNRMGSKKFDWSDIRKKVFVELLESTLAYKVTPKHTFVVKYTKLQTLPKNHTDFADDNFDISPGHLQTTFNKWMDVFKKDFINHKNASKNPEEDDSSVFDQCMYRMWKDLEASNLAKSDDKAGKEEKRVVKDGLIEVFKGGNIKQGLSNFANQMVISNQTPNELERFKESVGTIYDEENVVTDTKRSKIRSSCSPDFDYDPLGSDCVILMAKIAEDCKSDIAPVDTSGKVIDAILFASKSTNEAIDRLTQVLLKR